MVLIFKKSDYNSLVYAFILFLNNPSKLIDIMDDPPSWFLLKKATAEKAII